MDKIVLRGYYGFGNLGDDILMLVTYNLAKEFFPNEEIVICSNSNSSSYISRLIGAPVRIIKDDESLDARLAISGGGGVYFDFKEGGFKNLILNSFIKLIGYHSFSKLYSSLRKIKGGTEVTAEINVGLGIGIGYYTSSSQKFLYDIRRLASFDFLVVRDESSFNQAKRYNPTCPVKVSTDLAFLNEYWNRISVSKVQKQKRIGIVLRDWKFDNDFSFEVFHQAINSLDKERGIELFSFDKKADEEFIRFFTGKFPIHVWDPEIFQLDDYLKKIAECQLIVTARAHGAILAAGLGVPSLCLAIEPKLEQVAEMLKHSSVLIKKPFSAGKTVEEITNALQSLDAKSDSVKKDVAENREKMIESIKAFREFARTKSLIPE